MQKKRQKIEKERLEKALTNSDHTEQVGSVFETHAQKDKDIIFWNYTRNEWRRCKNTLETGGEDVKIHSKCVEKM